MLNDKIIIIIKDFDQNEGLWGDNNYKHYYFFDVGINQKA